MNTRPTSASRCCFATTMALAVAMTSACTSTGSGTGSETPGGAPVTFTWTSKDGGNTGTMTATLGAGATYSGPFLQVTSTVQTDAFDPLWTGWGRGWNDWGYWGRWNADPVSGFSTRYSGKVVANLRGSDGQALRCRFHLNAPATGMGGGGQGECQYAGGRTIDAVFTRS